MDLFRYYFYYQETVKLDGDSSEEQSIT